MSVVDRLRSLFRLFLLFTVLVAVALVSAITTIRLTIHGRQENMPKLVGVPLESAQRITSGLGLQIKVEDKIFSTQYAANEIAQQMPPAGHPVEDGAARARAGQPGAAAIDRAQHGGRQRARRPH